MNKNDITISLTLPNLPEFVSVARLTLSGVANGMGFNIEDIEDLKVAVSEACTNVLKHSKVDTDGEYNVDYIISDEELIIEVCDYGKGIDYNSIVEPNLDNPKENGLGLYIIKLLMDEVQIINRDNSGTTVRMIKKIGE